LVSLSTIILIGGSALFLLAGGGKFIAPAISKSKVFLSESKTLLGQTAASINNKNRERDTAG